VKRSRIRRLTDCGSTSSNGRGFDSPPKRPQPHCGPLSVPGGRPQFWNGGGRGLILRLYVIYVIFENGLTLRLIVIYVSFWEGAEFEAMWNLCLILGRGLTLRLCNLCLILGMGLTLRLCNLCLILGRGLTLVYVKFMFDFGNGLTLRLIVNTAELH
jgi:hypothetical protein